MGKFHEFSFKIVQVIRIVVSNSVNFLVNAFPWRQSIASGYSMTLLLAAILLLSPPSYILYTLGATVFITEKIPWYDKFHENMKKLVWIKYLFYTI